MKKVLSILLSLSIVLCSSIVLSVGAVESELEIGFAVASDVHYVNPSISDETETTFKSSEDSLEKQSSFILDEFLNQCAENENCQYVFITGDIATHGRDFISEHENVAAKFRAFENATGKQVFVINGNHDNAKGTVTDYKKFKEVYFEFGYNEAISVDEETCSYAVNLNDEYTLIAFDSCDEKYRVVPNNDFQRTSWLVKQLTLAKTQGKKVIMIMHHNILEHDPLQKIREKSYVVDTPYSYSGMLADLGVKLVFSGHTHKTNVTSYTSLLGNTIYDFSMPSLGNFPAEYKFVQATDDEIKYETKKINHIDSDKLAAVCEGYTQQELDLMENDFQAYTRNRSFGIYSKDILSMFSPSELGIEEDSALYPKAKSVTDNLQAMALTSIYGEGGIKQQAAEYGLEIPDSNFENLVEAMTTVALRTKRGEKIYSEDSDDFKVVARVIAFSIRKSLATAADKDILSSANEMLCKIGFTDGIANKALTSFCEKYGFATPCEKEAVSIVLALFGGFIDDVDGVGNREGTLPGYEAESKNESTVIGIIKEVIIKLLELVKSILTIIG